MKKKLSGLVWPCLLLWATGITATTTAGDPRVPIEPPTPVDTDHDEMEPAPLVHPHDYPLDTTTDAGRLYLLGDFVITLGETSRVVPFIDCAVPGLNEDGTILFGSEGENSDCLPVYSHQLHYFSNTPTIVAVDSVGQVYPLAMGTYMVTGVYGSQTATWSGVVGQLVTCSNAGNSTVPAQPQDPAPPRKRLIILNQYDPDPGATNPKIANNEMLRDTVEALQEKYEGDMVIVVTLGKGEDQLSSFHELLELLSTRPLSLGEGELDSVDFLGHGDIVPSDRGNGFSFSIYAGSGTGAKHEILYNMNPISRAQERIYENQHPDWITPNQVNTILGKFLKPTTEHITLHHCYSADTPKYGDALHKAWANALGKPVTGYKGGAQFTKKSRVTNEVYLPTGMTETAQPD